MAWGLHRAVTRRYPGPAALAADPGHAARLSTYLGDMVKPYGLRLVEGPVTGQSYGEMAVPLIDELAESDVDLLVLATDVPDITPGRATATYLSHVCPGGPLAFGVSDQGRATGFTGLRLIRDYALPRAMLLILEQSELRYDPGVPVHLPARHAAVGLLWGEGGERPLLDVQALSDVDDDALAEALAPYEAGTVVLGGTLAHLAVKADRVVLADADQPLTGGWTALAETPRDGRVVVLADYDPALRYLCVAAFGS